MEPKRSNPSADISSRMGTRSRAGRTGGRFALRGWFVLEVSGVITVAFELEAGGTKLFDESFLAAFRDIW